MACIVRFESNWADEFDVEGVSAFDSTAEAETYIQESWDGMGSAEYHGEKGFWFGTNEELSFDSFEEYKSCFKIIPCTMDKVLFLRETLFNSYRKSWGIFPG